MKLERFEKAISRLTNLFQKEGFYKDHPTKFEKDLFGKFIFYHSHVLIITSRLHEDIAEDDSFTRLVGWDFNPQTKLVGCLTVVRGWLD